MDNIEVVTNNPLIARCEERRRLELHILCLLEDCEHQCLDNVTEREEVAKYLTKQLSAYNSI